MKKLYFLGAFLLLVLNSFGQMTVNSGQTVTNYVQNVLLGPNVTVSNIMINGVSGNNVNMQVGEFNSGGSNMPISSGLILASGNATVAQGPNSSNGFADPSFGFTTAPGTDQDLIDLVNANVSFPTDINDWCILEFDFVPLGDTLRFNYVWASEEYDTYSESNINDVFGFFISGPGISGPFLNNAENIALIPGTSIPVGINTLNNGVGNDGPCVNCEYYNQYESDNFYWDNTTDPYYSDPMVMQFDGYTDVMTAIAAVQCGQTYHIKLAICDGSDNSYDSGVFLQRESFTSNLVVQVAVNFEVGGPDGNTIFEDCGSAEIVLTRPLTGDASQILTVDIAYSGTATMGVDYSNLPSQIVFNPGVNEIAVPIDAFLDGTSEGTESIHMTLANIAECSETVLQSDFEFYISDTAEPLVLTTTDYSICSGITQLIEPILDGGYGAYHFNWASGQTTEDISVSPTTTTSYFLTVSDTCGLVPASGTFLVTVLVLPPVTVDLSPSTAQTVACNSSVTLTAAPGGGDGTYSYNWTNSLGNTLYPFPDSELSYGSWNGQAMVYVEVTDGCGLQATDSVYISIPAIPLVIDAPTTVDVQCGSTFTVPTSIVTGNGGYYYTWYVNGTYDWNNYTETYSGTESGPGNLTVSVSDACNQTASADIAMNIIADPLVFDLIDEVTGNCTAGYTFNPNITSGNGNYVYTWTEGTAALGSTASLDYSTTTSSTVSLNIADGCSQEASQDIIVNVVNPAMTVDLGSDISASCIDNTLITPNATGGVNPVSTTWFINGVLQATAPTLTVQSFVTENVSVVASDACNTIANDDLVYNIPNIPLNISSSADTSICVDGTATIWALASGGEEGFTYDWSTLNLSTDSVTFSPDFSNDYIVEATDICGHAIQDTVNVFVLPIDVAIGQEHATSEDFTFHSIVDPECPNCTYIWDFGDETSSVESDPAHTFDGVQSYIVTLIAINEIGCQATDAYVVQPQPHFYIPNSFTPNNDGVNDVFQVVGGGTREFEMHIFNRWGDEIFTTNDINTPWTGDVNAHKDYYVTDGVYRYLIKAKGFNSEAVEKTGYITVFR